MNIATSDLSKETKGAPITVRRGSLVADVPRPLRVTHPKSRGIGGFDAGRRGRPSTHPKCEEHPVSERNTVVRSLHDLGLRAADPGLAAGCGGSLMGAVGLNGAAESEGGNLRTARIASDGWARWT